MGGGDLFIKRRIFERVISRYVFLDPCIIRKCINETREKRSSIYRSLLLQYRTKTRNVCRPADRSGRRCERKKSGAAFLWNEPCASDERLCACLIRSMPTFIDIGQIHHVSRVSDKRRKTVFTFRSNYFFPLYSLDFFFLSFNDEQINFNSFIARSIFPSFLFIFSQMEIF